MLAVAPVEAWSEVPPTQMYALSTVRASDGVNRRTPRGPCMCVHDRSRASACMA